MKQERINIAALLKDCPKGTKLYSPICGECELNCVEKVFYYPSKIVTKISTTNKGEHPLYNFYEDGKLSIDGECLLFPSKEVRDWGCFKVKFYKGNKALGVLAKNGGIDTNEYTGGDDMSPYYIDRITKEIKYASSEVKANYILSTGTELKLEEKEEPKFKVGNVVRGKTFFGVIISGAEILNGIPCYGVNIPCQPSPDVMLSEDCLSLATPEEIAKWNEKTLEPNHLHYSTSKRKIIHWFLPKDDVVVNDDIGSEWRLCTFSHYSKSIGLYCASGGYWRHCLPYNEKTEHLIGTTDDYEEE